jgi:hypothetical protein
VDITDCERGSELVVFRPLRKIDSATIWRKMSACGRQERVGNTQRTRGRGRGSGIVERRRVTVRDLTGGGASKQRCDD